MTELDGELPEVVLALIDEFGADVTYNRVSNGVYDPATSKAAKIVGPAQAKKAIPEDYSGQEYRSGVAAGLIKDGDKKFLVAAMAFDPAPSSGDFIGFNGSEFTVMNVKATYTGQLAAMYEIQGR